MVILQIYQKKVFLLTFFNYLTYYFDKHQKTTYIFTSR